jgi:hypothetical protein
MQNKNEKEVKNRLTGRSPFKEAKVSNRPYSHQKRWRIRRRMRRRRRSRREEGGGNKGKMRRR